MSFSSFITFLFGFVINLKYNEIYYVFEKEHLVKEKRVEINLGRLCNLECQFCMSSSTHKGRDNRLECLDNAMDELRELYSPGAYVNFLGGEPTAHREITQLIDAAQKLGYKRISLCTNGILSADMNRARELVEAGLTRVTLSVHSHSPDVEDGLTHRKGAFHLKEQAVRNYVALHQEYSTINPPALNTVVHKKNYKHLREFLSYFNKLGVREFRLNALRPEGRGRSQGARAYFVRYTTAAPHMLAAVLESWAKGVRVSCGGFPPCIWPSQVHMRDDVLGRLWADHTEVSRVVSEYSPGLGTERFSWDEMRSQSLKTKTPDCPKCSYNAKCEGVWVSYASIHGLKEFVPVVL